MPGPLLVAAAGLLFAAIVAVVAFVIGVMVLDRLQREQWPAPIDWPAPMRIRSPAEEDPPILCMICKRPIPPGRGRYRTEQGDVHEECYQEQRSKPKPAP